MNQNRTEHFDLPVFVKKRAFILPEKEDLVKNHKSIARRLFSGLLAFCMMFTMASTSMEAYAEELDGEQQPAVISAAEEETAETVQGEQEVDEENPLEEPVPDGQAEEPADTATPETAQEPLPDLAILDQSAGEQQVPVGEMADLRVKLNRDDVAVEYQWQKLSDPGEETMPGFELFSYAEDAPCTYAYLIDDMSETEWLSENPDASWSGIELYFAVADALDAIGEDCSNVQIVNGTENFALEGYALSAAKTEEGVRVFADLEDSHYTAIQNGEGKWQFSQGTVDAADVWQDIDGAAQAVYSYEVTESDAWTLYRCRITITDEAYLAESLARLEEQGVELSENALDAEQVLVSSTFRILPDGWEKCESDETENGEIGLFSTFASLFSAPSGSSGIGISSDTQWITGITGDYEYLSKETYDRIHGQVTAEQESRYWTKIGGDFSKTYTANVLDQNGMPTGMTRTYRGFTLTDNKLEVNSDWYGKTVYFRLQGSTGTGTAIEVPAYTSLNGAAGQTYKKAITVLNPYVRDSGTVYLSFLSSLNRSFTYADDTHIRIYSINCETFNADPNQFLMDAEGSYRMDSVAWGVNTELEPDLSGKAYRALKSYLGEGYGLMIGHDTLYAYAGSYYDAYGTDFDESSIDPDDTDTHYYAVNSWRPNDGHWRMNQLMGSNAGNVYAGNADPSRTASGILSSGGSHGQYGKTLMLGNDQLRIVTDGYSASLAAGGAKYRTPTNYPYSFGSGQIVTGSLTHTNGQIAFGKVWVEYNGQGSVFADVGCVSAPVAFTVKGRTGTNNFYLSGDGNFLMNQIGHLPDNSAHADEVKLLVNGLLYVSQRKQCEVCGADQNGRSDVHFAHRINSANASEVLTALRQGGSFWYSLNDCYLLTEDITLPENWQPIRGFTGHWDNDIYTITLAGNGEPVLEQAAGTGWNLGTDRTKGVCAVFDGSGNRTTGVARIAGNLNDLFGTNSDYGGYTVSISGSDNPQYLSAEEGYSCTVNSDSKYVLSNLPCIYDGLHGVLKVRVYDTAGNQVTQYGDVRVNVADYFWETCDTTMLYLYEPEITAGPIPNKETYEEEPVTFQAAAIYEKKIAASDITWQWRKDAGSTWQDIASGPWGTDYNISAPGYTPDAELGYETALSLTLNHTKTAWNGYQFRACFSQPNVGTTNSWEYYKLDKQFYTVDSADASRDAAAAGGAYRKVATPLASGQLTVKPWPLRVTQAADAEVWVGEDAAFTVTADYREGLTATWQYSRTGAGGWANVTGSGEFLEDGAVTTTSAAASNTVYTAIAQQYGFGDVPQYRTTSTLTVRKASVDFYGYHFRVKFSSAEGREWYSDTANNIAWCWDANTAIFGENQKGSVTDNRKGQLLVKPAQISTVLRPAASENGSRDHQIPASFGTDVYGQYAKLAAGQLYSNDTVTYTAIIYYQPTYGSVSPQWEYRLYGNRTPRDWNQSVASSIDSGMTTGVINTDLGIPASDSPYYNASYAGWRAMKSVMTISRPVSSMFDGETMTQYEFGCRGSVSFQTASGVQSRISRSVYGKLVIDYDTFLHHNGVNVPYEKQNTINGGNAVSLTDAQRYTAGKTSSVWQYPQLDIYAPRSLNTVEVRFADSCDSRDSISYDVAYAGTLGVVAHGNDKGWTFVTNTRDSVSEAQWETLLRGMTFTVYEKITGFVPGTGIQGGIEVSWAGSEDQQQFPPTDGVTNVGIYNGHAYAVVRFDYPITWQQARVKAREYYSPDVQEYGYLANITSEAEQNYFYNQAQIKAPNSNGWLGGYRDGLTWKWADGPEAGTAWFQQTSDVTDGGEWGWWHIGGSAINGMYNHWNSGEPNDTHFRDCQGEPYLHYWGNLGTWNDYPVNASDVYAMIVEFGGGTKQTITAVTHCVEDKDRIGTQLPAALSPEITVSVSDESKVYDGTELMPHIVVSSSEVTNPAQYVLATYSCSTASAGYSGRTLAASAGSGNGCINAGSYKVTLTLTQAAINAGYGFSADSMTTAALTIHQRPVTIESNDNNKVYDGSDSAMIRNIRIVSGIVNGDTVRLNTTSVSGTYDSKHTGTWNITPGSTVSLDTNPYQNYYLAGASYSGSIAARPLAVHSRYLEDAASPRNVKTYDGSDAAVISNIRVDNIVPGDSVWINKQSFAGTYATANAGETLTADGKAQPDRWLHLVESEITRSAQDAIFLVNDPFSDYCIASESYSGAIARAMLTAQLKGWKNLYGEGMQEIPWADEIYEVDKASDSWLKLEGLRGNDVLVIDPDKSRFVFELLPTAATHVGVYPISYDGLNETNYPVLSNYIVGVLSNTLEVVARKITITPDDIDRVTTSSWAPLHSSFAMELADGSYTELGTDSSLGYSCMNLIGDDTIFSMLRVKDANGQSQELSMPGYKIFGNIPYDTECTIHSPARYLQEHHTAADYKRCDFCEEYFDFVDGTEHADLAGYELRINRNTESGSTLSVVACENFYGELVEDYELVYGTGTIVVHPWARVQLEVTVPLNVCMYGYGGDGEVVEPTNYAITNYSNCNVHITNIRTGGGWELTEEPSRAGQMELQLQSTQLTNGDNHTARQAPWIISHADRLAGGSVELPVEVRARIAPGVNDAGETMATHAEYTVEIYIRDP